MSDRVATSIAALGVALSPALMKFAEYAPAADDQDAEVACVAKDQAPVHRRYRGKGGIVARLDQGTEVEILRTRKAWHRVAYGEKDETGWTAARYLMECEEEDEGEGEHEPAARTPPATFHPFGQPHDERGRPAAYLKNYAYDCSHDPTLKVSRWCGYCYEHSDENLPRKENFRPDERLDPGERAGLSDYRGSGFSRGHQAPDATLKVYGEQAQDESYLLSNMTPQRQTLNGGLWAKLEKMIRGWARDGGEPVCVTTGPVFYDGQPVQTTGAGGVAVPHAYYAIVMRGSVEEPDVLAFLVPHKDRYTREERDLERYLVAVDEVERATEFDFMEKLADLTEAAVEGAAASGVWE